MYPNKTKVVVHSYTCHRKIYFEIIYRLVFIVLLLKYVSVVTFAKNLAINNHRNKDQL